MDNNVYLVEHCTHKDAPIRSPTGIRAGLGEHLAPMKRSNKIPIGDQSGFGAWFANRVWGWRVAAPLQTRPIAIPSGPLKDKGVARALEMEALVDAIDVDNG
ncbi:hypothetical protein Tco_1527263 [Tanacetum coccineum]